MIKSMTGYGRAETVIDGCSIVVEIKSVNHRYFEFLAKTPRGFGFLDDKLKSLIQSRVLRGKVDLIVNLQEIEGSETEISINHSLVEEYVKALDEMSKKHNLRNDVSVLAVSRFTDVINVRKKSLNEEKICKDVIFVAGIALSRMMKMRLSEGINLEKDMKSRLNSILDTIRYIDERSLTSVDEYRIKLTSRLEELLKAVDIDEKRILTEAAIFADKASVAEETVRLKSHIGQIISVFNSDSPVGRKMDFIVQEINREINTIGAKVFDSEIARMVIEVKSEIEKIREQIQNIE